MCTCSWKLGLALVAICASVAFSGEASAPTAAQIRQWTRDLGNDSYQTREAATRNLIQTGKEAIAPVAEAAEEGPLEVTSRAVQVLHEIYKSDDLSTIQAVEPVLEQLV